MPGRSASSLAVVLALVLTACGGASSTPDPSQTGTRLFLPEERGAVPVVVLVPGGGWRTADPGGLVPLAEQLADAGVVAATTTYRAAADRVRFPTPVEDVLCAAAGVVAEAAAEGRSGGPLVLVGHSAGGHLALLAALRPDVFRGGDCSDAPVVPDAVVGLAGAFDVRLLSAAAQDLFGLPERDAPGIWAEGDVHAWVGERPDLPVLLVHGDADDVVPVDVSRRIGAALSAAGHPVELDVVPGEGHLDVFEPAVAGPPITAWLAGLPG